MECDPPSPSQAISVNAPGPSPKILAIRGGAVGDFVLTLPALRLLRQGFPSAHISILGYPSIAQLALLSGDADSLHPLEHGSMAPLFAPGAHIAPSLSQFFASFQLVISWLYDPDGIFRENLKRCGVSTILQGIHQVDPTLPDPAAVQLARHLEQLALYLEEPFPTLPRSRPPAPKDSPLTIAIHPGSGSPRKNWGYENWCATAAALQARLPNAHFRVISGEAESDTIHQLLQLLRQAGVGPLFHEPQDLPGVAATLSSSHLFLGHDSGISHLAAATGIPCGLLFGPTDPNIWAPRNPAVRVLRKESGSLAQIPVHEVTTLAWELLREQLALRNLIP